MRKRIIIVLAVLCVIMLGLVIASIVKNGDKIEKDIDKNKVEYHIKNTGLGCGSTPSYSYKEDDEGTLITICRGTKPTGGYTIDVKKVDYKDDTLYVYVIEHNPTGPTTQALTNPSITIHVNKKASKIVIKGNEDYQTNKKEQS